MSHDDLGKEQTATIGSRWNEYLLVQQLRCQRLVGSEKLRDWCSSLMPISRPYEWMTAAPVPHLSHLLLLQGNSKGERSTNYQATHKTFLTSATKPH